MSAPTHTERNMQTGSGYEQGCRCDDCVRANRDRARRRKLERLEARVEVDGRMVATTARTHGSPHTYSNHGCRCEPCSEANAQRCKEWKLRSARDAS